MKRCFVIVVLAVAILEAQQPAPQDAEKLRAQQQQQQQQELMRAQRERLRPGDRRPRVLTSAIHGPDELANFAAPQRTEGCVAQSMFADPSVDLQTIPLKEWLGGGETTQIPWK